MSSFAKPLKTITTDLADEAAYKTFLVSSINPRYPP